MEPLLFYLGKTVCISAVLFLYYAIFLKDRNFHHYNRFYLLSAVLISLLLPLLKIDYFTIELKGNPYLFLSTIKGGIPAKNSEEPIPFLQIIIAIATCISIFFLARFLYGIFTIFQLKKKYPYELLDGVRLYITDLSNAPFSFFKNLFWRQNILPDSDVGRQILKHEMIHIEQKHSYDQILMQTVSALFWFNPIFHLMKKEISLIHEYLADKKSLKNADRRAFAQMLLATHFSGKVVPGTSPLISSNLKKRLKMLQNPKTKFSYARRVLALPMLFTLVFAFIVKAKNSEIEKKNSATAKVAFKQKSAAEKVFINEISAADTIVSKKTDSAKIDENYPTIADDGALKTAREAEKNAEEVGAEEAKAAVEEAQKAADDAQKITAGEMAKVAKHLDKIKGEANKSQQFLHSKEYADAMDEVRKNAAYVNSPEFKKMLQDAKRAENEGKMAAEKAHAYTNSKEFKAMMENAKNAAEAGKKAAAEGRKAAAAALAYTNSAEFKSAVAQAKATQTDGNTVIVNGKNGYTTKTTTVTTTGIDDDDFDKIRINGRPATLAELHHLDRSTIVRTNIYSKITDGKKYKTVEVNTK